MAAVGLAIASPGLAEGTAAYSLTRTQQWEMTSASGEPYRISLALPEGAAPPAGYPVIFLLDPEWSFATLVETARLQEPFTGPAVIVGVGYPGDSAKRRLLDLTIPVDRATLPNNRFDPPYGAIGGADRFLEFITTRLKPAVASHVPVDRDRQALVGHSLGGLFVLHVLFTQPTAFSSYVAGSPSIWWGNRAIVGEMRSPPRLDQAGKQRILITVGAREQQSSAAQEAAAAATVDAHDRTAVVAMSRCLTTAMAEVDNTRWLAQALMDTRDSRLAVNFAEFEDEDHLSVVPAFLARAWRYALAAPSGSPPLGHRIAGPKMPPTDLLACTRPHQAARRNRP